MSENKFSLKFYVAGVRFHKLHTVSDVLEEGDTVDLIPEPSNKFDKFAVKIKYNNVTLGYVPKKFSYEVTELMDSDVMLRATIIQLQPEFASWTALKVEIEEV